MQEKIGTQEQIYNNNNNDNNNIKKNVRAIYMKATAENK